MDELFGSDEESVKEQKTPPEAEDLFGSDSEEETNAAAGVKEEQEELFGSDEENENDAGGNDPVSAMDEDSKKREDLDVLFGSDDEAAPAPSKVSTQSELSLPVLKKTLQAGGFGVAVTMPSFVKIQPRPYMRGDLDPEEEEERFKGAIDMVRWRYKRDEDGNMMTDSQGRPLKESNARMVKWSDGSYQLCVGSTVFNAAMVPVPDSYGYAQLKSEQKDIQPSGEEGEEEGVKQKPPQSCLNCIGKIEQKVKILPSSVDSDAHTKMSLKVTERYLSGSTSRQIGYKHHATIKLDPEKEMEERVKAEEAELRKDRKRKMMEGGAGAGRKKYSAMSARYLEEGADDEGQYDNTSLAHLKRGDKRGRHYGSSGEDSADEDRRYRRPKNNQMDGEMDDFIVNDEEEGGSDEYEEEESPQKSRIRRKAGEDENDDEDVFDDEEVAEEEDDGAENDEDVVASSKGPVRSKRMIVDSSDED